MAQKILLRRGSVGNIASAATAQGELLLATGSVGNLSGPFITMTGTAGTGTSTIVGKIYEGASAPAITSYPALTGTPFYSTGDQALYRLNHAGNQKLDLSGNLEGTTVAAMTVTTLTGTTINVTGDITGSNLQLSGNANIDGNIILGGNITIGDADTDSISLGGELTSNIIPDVDDTYALGSTTKRWNIYGVNSSISGSFSGSFAGSGADLVNIPATGVNMFDLTSGAGINTFTYDGTSAQTVSVDSGSMATYFRQNAYSNVSGDVLINSSGVATIQANSVALGTDTTGNYVGTLTASNGIITTGAATGEGIAHALSVDSGSMLPYYSGSIFSTVSGDILITSAGVATIQPNSVALGTDTTGNYVATLGTLTGLTTTGNTGEGSTPTLAVTYGSTANTAVQGNTALTVQGTTNEIEVTGGSITLGSGGTVTVGLPNDVTVSNNLTVGGNLTVQGTTTTVDSTTVNIGDNIIVLNAAGTVADGGIQVIDAVATTGTGSLLWNATSDYWYAGMSGSTHYRLTTFESQAGGTTNYIPKVNGSDRLVDSNISDSGTLVSVGTAFRAAGNTELQSAVSLTGTLTGDSTVTPSVLFLDASGKVGVRDATDAAAEAATFVAYNASGELITTSIVDGGTF